jgi:hypothetical protein
MKRTGTAGCGGIGRSTDTDTGCRLGMTGVPWHRNIRVRTTESVPSSVVPPMASRKALPQHGRLRPESGRNNVRQTGALEAGAVPEQRVRGYIDAQGWFVRSSACRVHDRGPVADRSPVYEPADTGIRRRGRPITGSDGRSDTDHRTLVRADGGTHRGAHGRTDRGTHARRDPCSDPRPDSCPDVCSHRRIRAEWTAFDR